LAVPEEFLIRLTFYIVAGLTIFFAFRIVISRNIFHSAIFLALALIGVAAVYLYLDAEFLAVVQILIYVGAVVTLFIFAIMLTEKMHDRTIRQANKGVLTSAIVALALFYILINVIEKGAWRESAARDGGLRELGRSLMSTYALPFEVMSLLLLVALVGAIVIGKTGKE